MKNLARVLQLQAPRPEVPVLPRPAPPRPRVCPESTGTAAEPDDTWGPLLDSGLLEGWPIY